MTGPYAARIVVGDDAIVLTETELRESAAAAMRFYQDATPALVDGALRCGVFAAAALIGPGEDARVEIHGVIGGKPTQCREATARRDGRGRFLSTLGSRFNERVFRGV